MCNLYSLTKGQAAIIALVRAMRDRTGNLPPMPRIFPDFLAPIARNASDGVRELAMARWGMPGPYAASPPRPSWIVRPTMALRTVLGVRFYAHDSDMAECEVVYGDDCGAVLGCMCR
jgi:putative SOS response-associated peptidase YedK